MPTTLEQVIEVVNSLPYQDREKLRKWLEKQEKSAIVERTTNQNRMDWIKANREKYARQYVALIENEQGEIKLVGTGKTQKEAKESALTNGAQNPFITFFYSENDVPFGGW